VVAAVALLAGAGCGRVESGAAPTCVPKRPDTLVLIAQSVPTATKLPCIASYPAGWHFDSLSVRNGRTGFVLDSDRAGRSAVTVELVPACDIAAATEIPSDEPGTLRYERILSVVGEFRAVRSYAFDGGCIVYRFHFNRQGRALVNEVSVAIGFVERTAVDALVQQRSGGALHL